MSEIIKSNDNACIEKYKRQAHFAIHFNMTKDDILDQTLRATDGNLSNIIRRFLYQNKEITQDVFYEHIIHCFKNMRNHYAHINKFDNIIENIQKSENAKKAYKTVCDFLKFAYGDIHIPEKSQKSILDTGGDITEDGIIFFACTVSTRALANKFIGGISGYKRTDTEGQPLRQTMLYYAYRDGYNLIASGTQDTTQYWRKAMEILDYIRKPVQGTIQAKDAEQNRAKKDETDTHSGQYDVRTKKDLFFYFATQWLEQQYENEKNISLSFLRKNGNTETKYKPDSDKQKKNKTYIIDKYSDADTYNILLPLYMGYRGCTVTAIIKQNKNIHRVLLSDTDLLRMVTLELQQRLELGKIANHHRKKKTKVAISISDKVRNRCILIKQRWEKCEDWHHIDKIKRIIWVLQNFLLDQKITDTKIADALRYEIINYQGKKALLQFFKDNNIALKQTPMGQKKPENEYLSNVRGFEHLLGCCKKLVIKWCDSVLADIEKHQNDTTTLQILNIKLDTQKGDSHDTLKFISPKFWHDIFETNVWSKILSANSECNYKKLNDTDFYKISDTEKYMSQKMYHCYIKDCVLYQLAEWYINKQRQFNDKINISLHNKNQCEVKYKVDNEVYTTTMALHQLGKSYHILVGKKGKKYEDDEIKTIFAHLDKKTADITEILDAKQKLQQGFHDMAWRWLRCEDYIKRTYKVDKDCRNMTEILDAIPKEISLSSEQKKLVEQGRKNAMHTALWENEENKNNTFKALKDLEERLKISKTE